MTATVYIPLDVRHHRMAAVNVAHGLADGLLRYVTPNLEGQSLRSHLSRNRTSNLHSLLARTLTVCRPPE